MAGDLPACSRAKDRREAQLALRRFFRFLADEGEIRKDPTSEMKLVNAGLSPQPTYTEAEVKRLIMVCDAKSLEGVRNRALLITLFDTGPRRTSTGPRIRPDQPVRGASTLLQPPTVSCRTRHGHCFSLIAYFGPENHDQSVFEQIVSTFTFN